MTGKYDYNIVIGLGTKNMFSQSMIQSYSCHETENDGFDPVRYILKLNVGYFTHVFD
jgi:hypothetical protein